MKIKTGEWIELTKDIWESLSAGDYFLLSGENEQHELQIELYHINSFLRVCPNNQPTQLCDRDYFPISSYSKILLIPKEDDIKVS